FEKSMVGPSMSINKNPYAIIALEGYGRQEQSIHSDVDLLLLFNKKIPERAEELIRESLYPLWDVGLDIGHATRTIKDCLTLSGQDFEVLTSLLDARFICGMSNLYSELQLQLKKKVIAKKTKKITTWLIKSNQARHMRFGDSTYLLEPNLKEGQGGLRDYHTMLWTAKIKTDLKQARDLERYGFLSHAEFQAQREALSFIWQVRNWLHYLSDRKNDQLYFEYQIKIAGLLNFSKLDGQQPVERFLSKLHGYMELVKQQHLMFLYELRYAERPKRKKTVKIQAEIEGLEIIRDRLNFTSPEAILNSPIILIKIFEESARLKIPINPEAKRLIKEFGGLVDAEFRASASALKSFERILITYAPTFNVLNEMLNTGFLAHYLPEIKGIINRIQYDEYHLYPVDKHSLRVVQTIKEFGKDKDTSHAPLCAELYSELKNSGLLLWAALLHDIGKSESGSGHAKRGAGIARGILNRIGYKKESIEIISFLIEKHLLLVQTATRRDVYDEETAILCGRKIQDEERLKMLYLLTVADSVSTGPKAWNKWTASLLRSFFLKTINILQKGELATNEAIEIVARKKEELLASASTDTEKESLDKLYNVMSPRYRLYTPAEDILEHVRLYKSMGGADFVWDITKSGEPDTRTVTTCAKDRPGLFSKIAGIFTLNDLNILDAQVYTWRNNIAIDIFKVTAPLDKIFENEKWEKAKKDLGYELSGKIDFTNRLLAKMDKNRSEMLKKSNGMRSRPNKIIIDNKSSSFYTIIEVFTYDFIGLLFGITNALFKSGLDIWIAKIATNVDQVVDIFYVRDFDGLKIDSPAQMESIKKIIEEMLPDV
ncbi:MAG: [protein-PII] uridylyltransferase, partial [Deltaproteobacteria bacterium]|nr:[protein-PII] uridylyltransferase [Deltaproteobacteria bacterium]